MSYLLLIPCTDKYLEPIVDEANEQYYVANWNDKFLPAIAKRDTFLGNVMPIESQVEIIENGLYAVVEDTNTLAMGACVHFYKIKRTVGKCPICGNKNKFFSRYSQIESTIFMYFYPCFDNKGRRLYLRDKPLFYVRTKHGIDQLSKKGFYLIDDEKLIKKKAEILLDNVDEEDYNKYHIYYTNTPYYVEKTKKIWRTGEVTCRNYLRISVAYLMDNFTAQSIGQMSNQKKISIVKGAIKHFKHAFGKHKFIAFSHRVPDVLVSFYNGQYDTMNENILCALGIIKKPVSQILGGDVAWEILQRKKAEREKRGMLRRF